MTISLLVKFKLETDRSAVEALDRAVRGVKKNSDSTLQNLRSGVERASWYSSCLFDKYRDVCNELSAEDRRFIECIYEVYKRRNIIADLMRLYLEEELKTVSESRMQYLDVRLTKLLANYQSRRLTKIAMANALLIIVVNSFGFKSRLIIQLNKHSFAIVTALSFYGKVQMAALAARKLKMTSPQLYRVLYMNNMEMLYFLVGEKINQALVRSRGLQGEERVISIIRSLTY